jgi:hypothetical protein
MKIKVVQLIQPPHRPPIAAYDDDHADELAAYVNATPEPVHITELELNPYTAELRAGKSMYSVVLDKNGFSVSPHGMSEEIVGGSGDYYRANVFAHNPDEALEIVRTMQRGE